MERARKKFGRKLEKNAVKLNMSQEREEWTSSIVAHQQVVARKMVRRFGAKIPRAEYEDVVQVPLTWVDSTRVDQTYILGVVVEVSHSRNV